MAEYKITTPSVIRIKGQLPSDIRGMHSLLKQEGCIDSENKFTDEDRCISLDDIQTRLAQKNQARKLASADMLLCVNKNRYLLADAKFNSENVKNLSPTELSQKLTESKALILSDDFTFCNAFYVLFKTKVLTPSQHNHLKRQFINKPQFRFLNAVQFKALFE